MGQIVGSETLVFNLNLTPKEGNLNTVNHDEWLKLLQFEKLFCLYW
jgi:hypothetical protein